MSDSSTITPAARPVTLRRSYLLIGLAGLVMVALIYYGYLNGTRLNALSSPLLAGIREIRLESAVVEHEVKEALLAHSHPSDPKIWTYLDMSVWYLENLMGSAEGVFGRSGLASDPAPAGHMGEHLRDLRHQLSELKSYPSDRRVEKADPGDLLMGYDHLLMAFRQNLHEIETHVTLQMGRKSSLFLFTHVVLALFCVVMIAAVSFMVRRYERYRAQSLDRLGQAVTELNQQCRERERVELALRTLNQKLEERVNERTRDLLQINQELESEIEERRQAENRLRESRNTLQTVIDGVEDALILVDQEMRIRMLNRVAAASTGLEPPRKALGRDYFTAVAHADSAGDLKTAQAVAQGQLTVFERQDAADPEHVERVSIYPVKEQGGTPRGAILRIADITEEKRFARRLIVSEKMASLGILVSSIAHEINNPNNFVTFNIPILQDYLKELIQIADDYADAHPGLELFHMTYPEFRSDVFKLVENIQHGASRISSFVANLREFSQGNGHRQRTWLELPAVVEKVISICRSQIKKKVKNFDLRIPPDQPPVYADEYSLEQILLNLIVNAAQAADKPEATITLRAASGASWREHTIISVADNGCGMDEATLGKIFDPFFTTKSNAEGTGLGLYVCHNLVQSLGGRIEVQSQLGRGTTFSIHLPDKERRKTPRTDPGGCVLPESLQQ